MQTGMTPRNLQQQFPEHFLLKYQSIANWNRTHVQKTLMEACFVACGRGEMKVAENAEILMDRIGAADVFL